MKKGKTEDETPSLPPSLDTRIIERVNSSASASRFTRSGISDDEDDTYSMQNEISQFLSNYEDLGTYPGAERLDYDFVSERKYLYTTNLIVSAAHMIKGSMGVGILSMHEAYMDSGIWTALAATVIIGFFNPYNTLMLVKIAQRTYMRVRVPKMTYSDLMETAVNSVRSLRKFRRYFRHFVDIMLIVEMTSVCSLYQITVATILKKTLEAVSENLYKKQLHVRVYAVIVAMPMFTFCIINNRKYVASLSLAADIFIVIIVIAAICYAMEGRPDISERANWKSIEGLIRFCGILTYSMDGLPLALPIENHMKNPRYFPTVVLFSFPISIVFCTLVGFFGYWKWGEKCISPVLFHLPMTVGAVIVYFMVIIIFIVSFAVQFWVPFKIIWTYLRKKVKRYRGPKELLCKFALTLLITVVSVLFPNIYKFVALVGNVFMGILTYILPPIIYCLLTRRDYAPLWKRTLCLLSIILGLTVVVGGLYVTVITLE